MGIMENLGAFMLAGMVMLQILAYQYFLGSWLREHTAAVILRGGFSAYTQVLEEDLLRCGYLIKATDRFVLMSPDELIYRMGHDDNGDGLVESTTTVRYFLDAAPAGATWDIPGTQCLLRSVDSGEAELMVPGVVSLDLTYYNRSMQETANGADVRVLGVEMTLAAPLTGADAPPVTITYDKEVRPLNLF
jgi:hypothetical protein